MAQQNALNNRSSTLTVDNALTVTAGDATVSAGNVKLPTTTATTGQLQINATRFLHGYGTNNVFLGSGAGNLTSTGTGETIGIGFTTLQAITTGSRNTSIGHASLNGITTGVFNTAIGWEAGGNNTGADSSNIYLMHNGISGESHMMRLGIDGTGNGAVDTVYLAGTNANISTAAAAGTINIATGAGAKVVTLGSTSGASSLALKIGTADFSIASATGTVMNILDTGEMTMPLQPAFLATHSAAQNNVTGNNTTVTVNFTTEVFDQNSDYDGTNAFTAPVTGRFQFNVAVFVSELAAGANQGEIAIVTSNRTYNFGDAAWGPNRDLGNQYAVNGSILADMDAGDTCHITLRVNGIGADTADIPAAVNSTFFSGNLVC
jgi:hypothetical protein